MRGGHSNSNSRGRDLPLVAERSIVPVGAQIYTVSIYRYIYIYTDISTEPCRFPLWSVDLFLISKLKVNISPGLTDRRGEEPGGRGQHVLRVVLASTSPVGLHGVRRPGGRGERRGHRDARTRSLPRDVATGDVEPAVLHGGRLVDKRRATVNTRPGDCKHSAGRL